MKHFQKSETSIRYRPASMASWDAAMARAQSLGDVRFEYYRAYEKNRRMQRLAAKARFDRKRPAEDGL